jgi:hypothetical protein
MADVTNGVELALDELENEPLPTHTREHVAAPADEVEIDYAEDGLEPRQEIAPDHVEREQTPPREVPPAEGVAELQRRLEGEQIARRQAEERAAFAEQARAQAAGSVQEVQQQFLQGALDSARQTLAVLKANLAEAYSVQDFNQVAEINMEIAKVTLREQQIDVGLEEMKTRPPPRPQPAPQPQPLNEVEYAVSQMGDNPNSIAWVRAHPEFITDKQKNASLMSAHYAAQAAGIPGDTAEYIRFVEDRVLGREQPRSVERREPVAEQPRRSAPPPAPVSRGSNGASNPTRVVLTREQRQTAHDNFPDEMREDPTGRKAEQAYAKNMLILQREGRMKVN